MKTTIRYGKKVKKMPKESMEPPRSSIRRWRKKNSRRSKSLGIAHFPVCIAKTQYSFSSDPKAYGVAKEFRTESPRHHHQQRRGDDRSGHGRNHADAGSSERAAGPPHRHRKRTDRRIELILRGAIKDRILSHPDFSRHKVPQQSVPIWRIQLFSIFGAARRSSGCGCSASTSPSAWPRA